MAKRRKQKRNYIVGKPLRMPAQTQMHYRDRIGEAVKRMLADVRKQIVDLMNEDYAQDHFAAISKPVITMDSEGIGSQLRILMNRLKAAYDQLFGQLAMGLSPWMVDNINRASATQASLSVVDMPNLKSEGAKLTLDIRKLDDATKQILKASVNRSTDFIKSIPDRYMNNVRSEVYDSIASGNGIKDLEAFFDKQESSITNWAHNTAMDQTRKTFNGLNAGRMRKIGVTKGEWLHSGGSQHPRELHEDFDGEVFDLNEGAPVGDDDGNMVMPGDEPNCRCTFSPVVEYDDDDEKNADDVE